jgi:hypothetical protein
MSGGAGITEISAPSGERRHAERERENRLRETRTSSPFLPILLLALALVLWFGFQTVILVRESAALATARDNQEAQIQAATKIRQALDAVARDTAKLAGKGNPNARLVVDELRKRGVTINPDAPPPAAAAPK